MESSDRSNCEVRAVIKFLNVEGVKPGIHLRQGPAEARFGSLSSASVVGATN